MGSDRFIQWGEEPTYNMPVAGTVRFDIAGESLKCKRDLHAIRSEGAIAVERQTQRRRSVDGAVDVYADYSGMAEVFKRAVNWPVNTILEDEATESVYTPSAHFRPASLTVGVARESELHNYSGIAFSGMRLSFGLGDKHFGIALTCIGADELEPAGIPDAMENDFSEPAIIGDGYTFQLSISDGTTTWNAWSESVDIQFGWNRRLRIVEGGVVEGSVVPVGIVGGGVVSASVKSKWFFDSDTTFLADAIRNRTNLSIELFIEGNEIESTGINESLTISFPVCKANGDPPTLRTSGHGNIDFVIDNQPLAASGAEPFTITLVHNVPVETPSEPIELLLNGSFEDDPAGGNLPNWLLAVGETQNWIRRSANPTAYHGTYYAFPGAQGNTEIYQEKDVAAYAIEIDAGTASFQSIGYLRNFSPTFGDRPRMYVEYRDGSGTVLATYDSGEINNSSQWVECADTRFAPALTRAIRVRLAARRVAGSNNDSYFDKVSLTYLNPP